VAGQGFVSVLDAGIFCRDFLERRPHHLAVDGVAGSAGFALEQRRTILGNGRGQAQRRAQGRECKQDIFHWVASC